MSRPGRRSRLGQYLPGRRRQLRERQGRKDGGRVPAQSCSAGPSGSAAHAVPHPARSDLEEHERPGLAGEMRRPGMQGRCRRAAGKSPSRHPGHLAEAQGSGLRRGHLLRDVHRHADERPWTGHAAGRGHVPVQRLRFRRHGKLELHRRLCRRARIRELRLLYEQRGPDGGTGQGQPRRTFRQIQLAQRFRRAAARQRDRHDARTPRRRHGLLFQ